jgi:hypothetical protein
VDAPAKNAGPRITPGDATTYVAIIVPMLLASLAASHLPARRAARVDPMVTMRNDRGSGLQPSVRVDVPHRRGTCYQVITTWPGAALFP